MSPGESFRTAYDALLANKFRALLTMLGIIIGVAAVIAMVAIGQGAQRAVMARISALGSNLLFVNAGAQRGGPGVVMQSGTSIMLKQEDADALLKSVRSVEAVVPELGRQAQVKYENRNWSTRVVGTIPEYEEVRNFRTIQGRYFNQSEVRGVAKVCVIGSVVAQQLFPAGTPLGERIRIAGQMFTVIGVLESKGQSGYQNPDDQVIVPLTTAQRRLFGVDYFTQMSVKVADQNLMDATFLDVERVLRHQHRLRADQDNDFMLRNQADIIATFQETQKTLTVLLSCIAAVSLIVGGIGIMNVMIISVTERTREIGIRKAVGARRGDILWQFLIESVVISITGGFIGIGLGVGVSSIMGTYGNWNTVISPQSVMLAFFSAMLVGVSFGMYPAWKAAMINVIEALRYE